MTIKELIYSIKDDLKKGNKINIQYIITTYLFNPSFRLLLNYRIGKYFSTSQWKIFRFIAYRYKMKMLIKWNCQISYNAIIGKGVKFVHPIGVVIGDGVIIKDNVTIWQQVTFGSHGKNSQHFDYPTIESNAKIFAGAKIFGAITIGENAVIGANAVVFKNIPANSTAVGIPAKIIHSNNR